MKISTPSRIGDHVLCSGVMAVLLRATPSSCIEKSRSQALTMFGCCDSAGGHENGWFFGNLRFRYFPSPRVCRTLPDPDHVTEPARGQENKTCWSMGGRWGGCLKNLVERTCLHVYPLSFECHLLSGLLAKNYWTYWFDNRGGRCCNLLGVLSMGPFWIRPIL